MTTKPDVMLYLSDSRGQYIPRDFAVETERDCISGVSAEDLDLLAKGPPGGMESDDDACVWYWDIWDNVLDHAVVTDPTTSIKYTVYQDGDVWLIPVGMEWDCKQDWYVWPSDETDETYAMVGALTQAMDDTK